MDLGNYIAIYIQNKIRGRRKIPGCAYSFVEGTSVGPDLIVTQHVLTRLSGFFLSFFIIFRNRRLSGLFWPNIMDGSNLVGAGLPFEDDLDRPFLYSMWHS